MLRKIVSNAPNFDVKNIFQRYYAFPLQSKKAIANHYHNSWVEVYNAGGSFDSDPNGLATMQLLTALHQDSSP